MIKEMFNIAIDGHAGSGKSALAEGLAQKLGIRLLNSGKIYRTIACFYKKHNYGKLNQQSISSLVQDIDLKLVFEDNRQIVYANGEDFSSSLRKEDISILTSQIARYPEVRDLVNKVQKNFANQNDCIIEGRDITSVVIPDAQVKFFVTADVKTRAQRRYSELKEDKSFEQVLNDIKMRDYSDEHRDVAPLIITKDAIVIDNTSLTLQQTIDKCYEIVKAYK